MKGLASVWLLVLVCCALSVSGLPVREGDRTLGVWKASDEGARMALSSSFRQQEGDDDHDDEDGDHDHEDDDHDHDDEGVVGGDGGDAEDDDHDDEDHDDEDHDDDEGVAGDGGDAEDDDHDDEDHDHDDEDHDNEDEGVAGDGGDAEDHDHDDEDHDNEDEGVAGDGGDAEDDDHDDEDHDHDDEDHDHDHGDEDGVVGDGGEVDGEGDLDGDHDHDDHDHDEGTCDQTCQSWKIGFLFFILAGGLVGGFLPLLFAGKSEFMTKISEALFLCSGGVLLAISLLDILVHAIEDLGPSEEEYWRGYPYALTIFMTGFLLDHLVESVGSVWFNKVARKREKADAKVVDSLESPGAVSSDEIAEVENGQAAGYGNGDEVESLDREFNASAAEDVDEAKSILNDTDDQEKEKSSLEEIEFLIGSIVGYIALSLHSVLAGLSLGIGDWETAVSFFIAIISHKSFASFAAASNFLKSNPKRWQFCVAVVSFSLVTPIGIAIGMGLTGLASIVAVGTLQALSAGMLVYVATVHTLEHRDGKLAPMVEYAAYFSGAVIITVVTVIITFTGEGHSHGH
eukprot:CAMPEP_0113959340 /NCGR_PEP_ID=MMETSP0011_2-20120614/4087_1 /TAXON_ID=101924 /ORGANISM="Rhodosorus marinus" /LENGTH=568 /DNA_ID=CAMNT_0000970635 /DNA_START=177 /DNA_END=1883 /DNA_ORIENTATION=- /assembly_acc=CAM_ASM_000156